MKNNKKGFTLIELLAVIAILAILVVLAVPSVLDLFNGAKSSAFKTQAQSIFKAAEDRMILDQVKLASAKNYIYTNMTTDTGVTDPVYDLKLSGTASVFYCLKITGNKVTDFFVGDMNFDYKISNPNGIDISHITDDNMIEKTMTGSYVDITTGEGSGVITTNPTCPAVFGN